MGQWLRRSLGSLALAALLLVGLELGLRLAGIPDLGIYAGDPGSIWWLQANLAPRLLEHPESGAHFSVRSNEAGCRGGPVVPGSILCLGDSTTFGWGVEEEQAWPAQLSQRLGLPTVNGGVPGHSTHQGLARLDVALDLAPAVVVLAYLVRDAELTERADHLRRPWPASNLLRLLWRLQAAPDPVARQPLVPRVSAARYRANLEQMIRQVRERGAQPLLLGFPMLEAPEAHLEVIRSAPLGVPTLLPQLSAEEFFSDDPLHLTPAGHALLAEAVADWIQQADYSTP